MNLSDIVLYLKAFKNRVKKADEISKILKNLKVELLKKEDEKGAKLIWCYETVLLIQTTYIDAFNKMKNKDYYKAWCLLERCEDNIMFLKSHFSIDNIFYLNFIEEQVGKFQCVFPYKYFLSPEIIIHEKECNICGSKISIHNYCGHRVGEIYDGKMCCRIIKKLEFIGAVISDN